MKSTLQFLLSRYLGLYSEQKLLQAFEHGVVLSQVALEQKVEIDAAFMERSEETLKHHFRHSSENKVAREMQLVILSMFEPNFEEDATTNKEA